MTAKQKAIMDTIIRRLSKERRDCFRPQGASVTHESRNQGRADGFEKAIEIIQEEFRNENSNP